MKIGERFSSGRAADGHRLVWPVLLGGALGATSGWAKQFLADNGNDLMSLARILGHKKLRTTSPYSQRRRERLAEEMERLKY